MANRSRFELVDRILGGTLAETLRRWKHVEGLTFDEMANKLREDHDISVTRETLRRWTAPADEPAGDAA